MDTIIFMFVLQKNLSENLENYKSFLRIVLSESNPKSIINFSQTNLFPFKKIYVNINEIEISEAK